MVFTPQLLNVSYLYPDFSVDGVRGCLIHRVNPRPNVVPVVVVSAEGEVSLHKSIFFLRDAAVKSRAKVLIVAGSAMFAQCYLGQ